MPGTPRPAIEGSRWPRGITWLSRMPTTFPRRTGSSQVAALRRDPEAIVCFTGHRLFDERGLISSFSPSPEMGRRDSLDHIGRCLVFCPTVMFDRERSRGLCYPRDVVFSSDMCFVSLLCTRGHFIVLPESLCGYSGRSGQLTRYLGFLEGFRNRLRWLDVDAHRRDYWGSRCSRRSSRPCGGV